MQEYNESFFNIDCLVGEKDNLLKEPAVLPVFDEIVLQFLSAISRKLVLNKTFKQFPELVTFGFWCREQHLVKLQQRFQIKHIRSGVGTVFHIAPNNIPLNFAYSLVSGLLSGNKNIVKLGSVRYPEQKVLCSLISNLLVGDFCELSAYIFVIYYEKRHEELTRLFTDRAAKRIIWGGDSTVKAVKGIMLNRGRDVDFPSRYAIAVIDADDFLSIQDKNTVIRGFYNDVFPNQQNSCSSPIAVCWLGKKKEKAQNLFWDMLNTFAKRQNTEFPSDFLLNNITVAYKVLAKCSAKFIPIKNSVITVVETVSLKEILFYERGFNGFFFQCNYVDISNVVDALCVNCQTITYFGDVHTLLKDEIVLRKGTSNVRVVSFGNALNFDLIWDGKNLMTLLTKKNE